MYMRTPCMIYQHSYKCAKDMIQIIDKPFITVHVHVSDIYVHMLHHDVL